MKKTKSIIDKIKEENIKQKPKWYFVLSKILNLLTFIICMLIGSLSFSVILFSIQQTDFDLISHMSHSRIELFLSLLPFFWITVLLIFLFGAIFIFKKSERGYKYPLYQLVVLTTAISFLFGTLFFIGGGSHWLENVFAEKVNFYENIHEKKMIMWMRPEEGFLSGTIEKVSEDEMQLTDFSNKKWNVNYKDAYIHKIVFIKKGEKVKLIGNITQGNKFLAKEIRPWNGKKKQNRGRNRSNKNIGD